MTTLEAPKGQARFMTALLTITMLSLNVGKLICSEEASEGHIFLDRGSLYEMSYRRQTGRILEPRPCTIPPGNDTPQTQQLPIIISPAIAHFSPQTGVVEQSHRLLVAPNPVLSCLLEP